MHCKLPIPDPRAKIRCPDGCPSLLINWEMIMHNADNPALPEGDAEALMPISDTTQHTQSTEIYTATCITAHFSTIADLNISVKSLPTTTASHSHEQFLGSNFSPKVSYSCSQLFPIGQINEEAVAHLDINKKNKLGMKSNFWFSYRNAFPTQT